MLLIAVGWAFAWGAHSHSTTARPTTALADLVPQRTFEIDASDGRLDLSGVAAQPGEVIDLVVRGAPGAHAFVLQGAQPGAETLVRPTADGGTVIRFRVPDSGQVGVICTTPGHENLHGNITVPLTQ